MGMTATSTYASAYTINTWGITDGGGAQYTPRRFARAVGDRGMVRRLADGRKKSIVGSAVLGVGGAVVTLIGVALISSAARNATGGSLANRTGGIVVVGIGATALTTCYLPFVMTRSRQQWVSNYYTPRLADQHVESFNEDLRVELGIDEETALSYEADD